MTEEELRRLRADGEAFRLQQAAPTPAGDASPVTPTLLPEEQTRLGQDRAASDTHAGVRAQPEQQGSWGAVLRDAAIRSLLGTGRMAQHALGLGGPVGGASRVGEAALAQQTGQPPAPSPADRIDPFRQAEQTMRAAGIYQTPDAVPTTQAQRYVASGVEGAVGGLPFGPMGALAGAAGGVAGEGAAQGAEALGASPGWQAAARLGGNLAGGAVTPGVANMAGRLLPGRGSSPAMQAFDNLNIEPRLAAAVSDVPGVAQATGIAGAMPGGGRIEQATVSMLDDLGAVVDRSVRGLQPGNGTAGAMSPQAAGGMIQHGVENWVQTSRGQEQQLWQGLFARLGPQGPQGAGRTMSGLPSTRTALQSLTTATEREMPDLAAVLTDPVTTNFRRILAQNPQAVSAEVLREFRTHVGAMVDDAVLGNVQQGAARRLYTALSDDIRDAARRAGAIDLFEAANNFTRNRHMLMDRFGQHVIGRGERTVDPEQAFQFVVGASGRGDTRLRGIADMTGDQPVLGAMGTAMNEAARTVRGPGAAGGLSDTSAANLNRWLGGRSEEATEMLRRGMGGTTLDDIRTVAGRMQAAERFANTSKTGNVLGGTIMGTGLGAAAQQAVTGNMRGAGTAAAGAAAPYAIGAGGGALLTNPMVARFLARNRLTQMGGGGGAGVGALPRLQGLLD